MGTDEDKTSAADQAALDAEQERLAKRAPHDVGRIREAFENARRILRGAQGLGQQADTFVTRRPSSGQTVNSASDWRYASLQQRATKLDGGRDAEGRWILFHFGGDTEPDLEDIDPDDDWETIEIFQHVSGVGDARSQEHANLVDGYGAEVRSAGQKVRKSLGWPPSVLLEFYRRADAADLPGKAQGLSGQRRRDQARLERLQRRLGSLNAAETATCREWLSREWDAFDAKYRWKDPRSLRREKMPGRSDSQVTVLRRKLRDDADLLLREIAIVEVALVDASRDPSQRELSRPTMMGVGQVGDPNFAPSVNEAVAMLCDRIAKALRPRGTK